MSERRPADDSWARQAWESMESSLRAAVVADLRVGRGVPTAADLATHLLEHLKASDPELGRRVAAAPAAVRAGVRDRFERVSTALLVGTGEQSPDSGAIGARAYGEALLEMALPLVVDLHSAGAARTSGQVNLASSGVDGPAVARLLRRVHGNEPLSRSAHATATSRLAHMLMVVGGVELLAKVEQDLGPPAAQLRSWLPKPQRLLLSVDRTSLSCGRYLAGLQDVRRDGYGFDQLEPGTGGRAKRIEQATVKFDPVSALGDPTQNAVDLPSLAPLPGSELKAKLFVALLSLSAEWSATEAGGTPLLVRLRDLLAMTGYVLGRGTNSTYYWRHAAHLVRYLLTDLPARVVAMQVSYAGESGPRVVFERLLSPPVPLDRELRPLTVQRLEGLVGRSHWDPDEAGRAIRETGLSGFELTLGDDLQRALGLGRPLNAVEHLPLEVLTLRGPAFWLAWQIAFLRRWARPPGGGGQGKPLRAVLAEAGYLSRYSRRSVVRYKDALSRWWRDVGTLTTMGVLDEPGARLYRLSGTEWRDVSNRVSKALDAGGGRIAADHVDALRVVYAIPRWRIEQLEQARRRKRSRRGVKAIDGTA